MHPTLFTLHLFGRELPYSTYGFMLAVGFGVTLLVTWRLERERLSFEQAITLGIWTMVGTALGARLLHSLMASDGGSLARIDGAGFAFYGGFVGTVTALWAYCRSAKLPFLPIADAFALGLSLGMVPGRLACWFAGCCYGRAAAAPLPSWLGDGWAWPAAFTNTFTHPDAAAPLHTALVPTQLLMSANGVVLFALLWFGVRPRASSPGQVFAAFLIAHAALRAGVEFFRDDPRGHYFGGYVSTSQLAAVVAASVGAAMLLRLRRAA